MSASSSFDFHLPKKIDLQLKSNRLVVHYSDQTYCLTAEYLRVLSPSAEVKGHGGKAGELPVGKKNVVLSKVEAVGHYAVRLVFDDGHDSGLYTWHYLYELCIWQKEKWQAYLEKLDAINASRDPEVQVVRFVDGDC